MTKFQLLSSKAGGVLMTPGVAARARLARQYGAAAGFYLDSIPVTTQQEFTNMIADAHAARGLP